MGVVVVAIYTYRREIGLMSLSSPDSRTYFNGRLTRYRLIQTNLYAAKRRYNISSLGEFPSEFLERICLKPRGKYSKRDAREVRRISSLIYDS